MASTWVVIGGWERRSLQLEVFSFQFSAFSFQFSANEVAVRRSVAADCLALQLGLRVSFLQP
jgi:hypothetical protein